MRDSELLDKIDSICNNPTEEEIRFSYESDIISSDNSDVEQSNASKPKKYNQLHPRAEIISKLLQSIRPVSNTIWRTAKSKTDFWKNSTEDEIRCNGSSNGISSDDSEIYVNHSIKTKVNTQLQSRPDILDKSLQSTTPKGNDWKTIESKVYLQGKCTESELLTVSSEKMAKSHKRKRESSGTDEESNNLKKIKTNGEKSVSKKVKRKEINHNISASESECSNESSDKIESEGLSDVNKLNRNPLNTHLLSSESDNDPDDTIDFASNTINSDKDDLKNGDMSTSDHASDVNSEEQQMDLVKEIVEPVSKKTSSGINIHRIPKFTPELNEEMSRFSLLLDENLTEKNDIWILQCPSNMDCSSLISQRLNLGDSGQLNNGERIYETYSYRNSSARSATVAVPSERNRFNLCRIPITGNIIIEESVKPVNKTRIEKIIPEAPSRVEFPENLRTRHPLLGLDFSKQPRTAERVEITPRKKNRSKKYGESFNESGVQSLEESVEVSVKKSKKKKKHKEKNN